MKPAELIWLSAVDMRISDYHRMARDSRKPSLSNDPSLEKEELAARKLLEEKERQDRIRLKHMALDDVAGLLIELTPEQLQGFEDAVKRRSFFS